MCKNHSRKIIFAVTFRTPHFLANARLTEKSSCHVLSQKCGKMICHTLISQNIFTNISMTNVEGNVACEGKDDPPWRRTSIIARSVGTTLVRRNIGGTPIGSRASRPVAIQRQSIHTQLFCHSVRVSNGTLMEKGAGGRHKKESTTGAQI